MERKDFNVPFMLKYENIAWYEDGVVKILDRRIYPKKIEYVECRDYKEVSLAIKNMVTQSAGPYTAVGMGMALAAYQCKDLSKEERKQFLTDASKILYNSRPTTSNRMKKITDACLEIAFKSMYEDKNVEEEIKKEMIDSLNRRYSIMEIIATHLSSKIKDGDKVLTQCFGETIIGMIIKKLIEEKKTNVEFYCAETRPYLQGARLTATCFSEMGFKTTVITDNMIAYVMENIGIDLFTSAADTITRDGHIANKIGTFQIALIANRFNVPYLVTGIPDIDKFERKDIKIEMRDATFVLGDHTHKDVLSIYPSFDITPPTLITGVVTDKGIYSPINLNSYFDDEVRRYY